MISALGIYIALECVLYLAATVLMLPVAVLWGGERLRRFTMGLLPPQAVAASTQSSLASLPAMLQSVDRNLGYPREVASLVLPRSEEHTLELQSLMRISYAAFSLQTKKNNR